MSNAKGAASGEAFEGAQKPCWAPWTQKLANSGVSIAKLRAFTSVALGAADLRDSSKRMSMPASNFRCLVKNAQA